jgi:hypothetical protein
VGTVNAFGLKPIVNFVGANYEGTGAKGNGFGVGNMIGMAVGDSNIIGLNVVDIDVFGFLVATNEGVD